MLISFDDVISKVRGLPMRQVAIAAAHGKDIIRLAKQLINEKIAQPILIGRVDEITRHCSDLDMSASQFEIIDANESAASSLAVSYVNSGKADFVMKGLVHTGAFLRAVLDRENGLRTDRILSEISIVELVHQEKLLLITDCAVNINPDLSTKVKLIQNAADFYELLSPEKPKVAVLAALEIVNPDMPETVDAAILTKMGQRGQIGRVNIDGPLALDNILSSEAARHKGLESPVAGQADIILVPDLKTGNVLHKAAVFLAGFRVASFVSGTKKPVVMTSRSDSMESKFLSVALAGLAVTWEGFNKREEIG